MRHTALLSGLLVALACGGENDPVEPITGLPRSLSVAEQDIVRAGNTFGIDLFREVHAHESMSPNVFLSPLSAHMALGMALTGATGETYDAMRSTLGFGSVPEDEINASYRDLVPLLVDLDPRVDIAIANSLWYRHGFTVEQPFIETLRRDFRAEVNGLDFDSPGAPGVINGWVRDHTSGRIDRIVESIGPQVVAYLINAVAFKAKWTKRFDPDDTRPGRFRLADGREVDVRFMNRADTLDMLSTDLFTAVDLSYGGGAWRMTVLLPRENVGVDGVLAALTPQRWEQWTTSFATVTGVTISLPKFRIEYDVLLNDALSSLGMGIAFDDQRATFGRISRMSDLYLSKVRQKTFVEVNEEGTEAAAATAVEVSVTSVGPAPFVVNRPFIVAIRERHSGTLLFLGAIGDPTR